MSLRDVRAGALKLPAVPLRGAPVRARAVRVIPLFLMILAGVTACRRGKLPAPVNAEAFLVDTRVQITVYEAGSGADGARSAADRCIREIRAAEGRTTAHVDTSDISRINAAAGKHPVAVPAGTFRLIEQAIDASRLTEGGFDPVLGGLKDLWGFDTERPAVPRDAEIRRLLRASGTRQLELDKGTVFLRDPGAAIDLGGLGEGYLIDLAVLSLRRNGVRSGIVEATGDLAAFGRHPQRPYWRIGVKNPRDPEGKLIGVIRMGEEAVATSGDYERYFIQAGRRYCHIIDPRTGYPPVRGCISVTVVAPTALEADAYATGLFTLDPDTAMAVIERLPGVEGIIMTEKDGRIRQRVSSGLKERYEELK
jgi:FAD:protein FMN transferase